MAPMRIALLAALAGALLAQEPPPTPDPWAGFGIGSWIIVETTSSVDNQSTTERERITFAATEGTRPILHVRKAVGDEYPEPDQVRTHQPPGLPDQQTSWKAAPVREEKIDIGGRKVACKVSEFTYVNAAKEISNRVTVWKTSEVKIPYREVKRSGPDLALMPDVVKIEFRVKAAKQSQQYDYRVIQLDAKRKVGSKEIPCVLEEGVESETKAGISRKGTMHRWLSDAVPGRIVHSQYSGDDAGKPVERIESVLSFEAKK